MNWGGVRAVVARDLRLLFRERSTLLFSVVFPILMLIFLASTFAPSEQPRVGSVNISVAVVPENASALSYAEEVAKYLRNSSSPAGLSLKVTATVESNLTDALARLRRGDLDAVVAVPADAERGNFTVYILRGTPDPTREQLVASYLYSFFDIGAKYEALALLTGFVNSTASAIPSLRPAASSAVERAWRVATSPRVAFESVTPGEGTATARALTIGWMTLSVIFISFMFGGVVGGARGVVAEVRYGFLQRLLSTRLTPPEYFAGLALGWLASLTLAALPTVALGFGALGGRLAIPLLSWETALVIFLMLVAELLTFSLGVLIGVLTRSPEAASFTANILVLATQILGGFWVPKWMLPESIRAFAEVNPLSILFYGVSEVAVFRRPITAYLAPVAATIVATAALFALASVLYVRMMPRAIEESQ